MHFHLFFRRMEWRLLWLLCLSWVLSSMFSTDAMAQSTESGIAVIMAPGIVVPGLNRDVLALIFTSKKRFWDAGQLSGLRIQPVNLSASHPLRHAFSLQLLHRSPEEMDDYWQDMYFHGISPPFVLASEEAVIRFVARTPGAIGYISHCVTDHRVNVVMQLDSVLACPR